MNENEVSPSALVDHTADNPSSDLVTQDSDDPLEQISRRQRASPQARGEAGRSEDALQLIPDAFQVDHHEALVGQRCLKSRLEFEVGDVLASFSARRHCKKPHRMTVQVGESSHIELAPLCIELINHSCDPNVFFDVTRMEIVALKSIAPRDELTFFYPSTEWQMESPFDCECKTHRCVGRIDGASRLGRVTLSAHRLNAHIEARFAELDHAEKVDRAFDIGLFLPLWESLVPG